MTNTQEQASGDYHPEAIPPKEVESWPIISLYLQNDKITNTKTKEQWDIEDFPPIKDLISQTKSSTRRETLDSVRDKVTEYVQEAIKDPKSDNYIYADMIPLGRLDKILSNLNNNE